MNSFCLATSLRTRERNENQVSAHTKWITPVALAALLTCFAWPVRSSAQVPSWAKTYDVGGGGGAADVRQTPDGGFLAAGWTKPSVDAFTDMWLVRLDAAGNVVWQRSYGGSGRDEIETLHPTPDGGYIGIGLSSSFGASNHAPLVLKFDANGNVQWQKTYLSSGRDWGFDIVQTSDGGYVIPGMTDPCACGGTTQGTIIKIDASGGILWQKIYTGQSTFSSIRQTSDGGYILGGATASFGAGGGDALVIKLDSNGNIQWQNNYGGSGYDAAVIIQLTNDGGFILAGSTQSFGSGGTDAWLLKLNSDGSVAWQKAYGGSGDETASYVEQTADGGYIVSGYTTTGAISGTDLWVFKTDSAGNFIWQRSYDSGSPSDNAYAIHPTSDGGYMVAGNSDPGCPFGCVPPATPQKFTILKLKSDGSIDPSCATGVGTISTAATANTSAVILAAPLVLSAFNASDNTTNVTVTPTSAQTITLCSTRASCNPPRSIVADNSAAFGLINAVVSNQQLNQGELTADVRISNDLRVWLGLTTIDVTDSDPTVPLPPDFSPNLTAGLEGITAKAGLLPPCQTNTNPFTRCNNPGASSWIAEFCGAGNIVTTFRFTTLSAAVTLTGLLAPPGLSTNDLISLSGQLETVPELNQATACFVSSRNRFQCVMSAINSLRKDPQQLSRIQQILKSFAIDITITQLITKLFKLGPDIIQIEADLLTLEIQTRFSNQVVVSIKGL